VADALTDAKRDADYLYEKEKQHATVSYNDPLLSFPSNTTTPPVVTFTVVDLGIATGSSKIITRPGSSVALRQKLESDSELTLSASFPTLMAAKTNGLAKAPQVGDRKMNGQVTGSINTSESERPRERRRRRRSNKQSSYVGWLMDKLVKVTVWYTIITFAFRCPTTQDAFTDSTPAICKPYLQTKDFLTPYGKPYYDQYLAPHVQRAQPYIDRFNEQVYDPSLKAYQQHGAPRVEQGRLQAALQWNNTVKPQLEVARQQASKQYDTHLSPHVKTVQDVVQPYYDSVANSASDIWELELHPVYRNTAPYAQKMYTQGYQFAVDTVLPQAQYASSAAWSFGAAQVWPKLTALYGENVEPQLMRITERLGRYKDGKKLQAEVKNAEISSSLADASSSVASAASSASSFATAMTDSPSSAAPAMTSSATPEPSATLTEQFHEDLKNWQNACHKAVNEGSEHLKERIKEFTDHQITSQLANSGEAHVTQLEKTADGAISSVKAHILALVGGLPKDADDSQLEETTEKATQGIRNAGKTVRESAQSVRDWKPKFTKGTDELAKKALESTLETIDSIREIRLSEIGRKYADKDLPHKEWSKYNELKKATQAWRDDVAKVVEGNADINKVKSAADEVESRAMAIAEETAQELKRLKAVAQWKIDARDATDSFNSRPVVPAAAKANKKVADTVSQASEAVLGISESAKESVKSATTAAADKASEVSSSASDAATGSAGSVESAASHAKSSASSVASDAYAKVAGSEQAPLRSSTEGAASSVKSAASVVPESVVGTESSLTDSATDAASTASESVIGTESGLTDSVTDAASAISAAVIGSDTPGASGISSGASSVVSEASSQVDEPATAMTLNPRLGSLRAAIQEKQERASRSAAEAAAAAGEGSSKASSAASEATESPSSIMDNAASSISSVASDASAAMPDVSSVSSAGAKASKKVFAGANAQVLVEVREPILDDIVDDTDGSDISYSERIQSMASAVGDRATDLTKAVMDAMKPTATPSDVVGTASGVASSVSSLASDQYERAMQAASSVLFGEQSAASTGSAAVQDVYSSAVAA